MIGEAFSYLARAIDDLPVQALVLPNLRLAGNESNELDLCIFGLLVRVTDGAISVIGEALVVSYPHIGLGD